MRTRATRTDLDKSTILYMEQLRQFFAGDAGYLRMFGGAYITGPLWMDSVYKPYQVILASQGQSAPEISPWRFNGATTYSFDHGRLKGFYIGGAGRQDAPPG